jgi:hypothetical protein
MRPDESNSTGFSRIRRDDVLIKLPAVRAIMAGMSTSAVYDDPDLMRLKINLMVTERSRAVRWIEREIYELRAQRVARSTELGTNVPAQIERRRERRRARQRASA